MAEFTAQQVEKDQLLEAKREEILVDSIGYNNK